LFLGDTVSPLPFRAVLDVSPLADGTRSFIVSSFSSPVYSNSSSYLSSHRAALFFAPKSANKRAKRRKRELESVLLFPRPRRVLFILFVVVVGKSFSVVVSL
jgi:hypothetical protein